MDKNCPAGLEHELSRLLRELQAIDEWNRMFAAGEINADSYVARQRRRWEIVIRIKALQKESQPLPIPSS
jgi:hypothetical protein